MAATAKPLRVTIVSDVARVVDAVAAVLAPFHRSIRLVDRSAEARAGIDVAIVDAFGLPHAGVERVRDVAETGQAGQVALYTWKISPALAVEAVDAGAGGILAKSAPGQQLVGDLARVHCGTRVVHHFPIHVWTDTWIDGLDSDAPPLTAREAELLSLVGRGCSNTEIGSTMFLAESSVKTYLKRVYRKLGVGSRAAAGQRAIELGLAGPRGAVATRSG